MVTVFGILNLTEDSFFDESRRLDPAGAVTAAIEMLRVGSDVVDVGPAASHPDARPVSPADEIRRIAPLLDALSDQMHRVSIDSFRPETQRYALKRGVTLKGYREARDLPDRLSTSRLSPHLRFGEISPRQIWHATRAAVETGETPGSAADVEKFFGELGWREFSYHLLFHNPDLASVNYDRRFDAMTWETDEAGLKAWQKGLTGYPIVDAGLRELWQTGWMHNRVRMITASFLIKHLLTDWRAGETWFWDTLVDADPANNPASWQWVAGSGADAAPYFRIFNPVTQGEKFDPKGAYVRRFVPELAELDDKFIHRPWEAPASELTKAGIVLGRNYPKPIISLDFGRRRALDAFASLRSE